MRREIYDREFIPHKTKIIVDEPGLGGGVIDILRQPIMGPWEQIQLSVLDYNGGRRAHRRDKFENARSASFWHLRKLLEDEQIELVRDEALFQELMQIEFGMSATGKLRIEPKDQIRKRLGRSIDRADAVVMAFAKSGYYSQAKSFTVGI